MPKYSIPQDWKSLYIHSCLLLKYQYNENEIEGNEQSVLRREAKPYSGVYSQ